MRELHLFAGAGGGILAGQLLGHRCVCAVEREPYAQAVLVARQNDGTFPPFPIWDDVQNFDGRPWRGIVDVVCGGFPCQDISVAGNGAGIDGERSGMWHHMARIIGEVRPRYVIVENSPALTSRGLGRVLADLAALGFDAQWGVLGASDVGAPHKRERIWIVANANSLRKLQPQGSECNQRGRVSDGGKAVVHTKCASDESAVLADSEQLQSIAGLDASMQRRREGEAEQTWVGSSAAHMANSNSHVIQRLESEPQQGAHRRQTGLHGGAGSLPAWPADPADAPEPGLGRVVNGMAHRSHRLKAIGNGQVPRVAAAAWKLLTEIK